ncbi:spore coat protein [Virgibacillus dakarensis]|uniref:Spore coat protein n=1 Tax=Lentibacillus populi TaxID=1827502 RepID=A0A9W5TYJ7_9BACI|nr:MULTISPECIES: spore coat protein [Bacillaceae]MBT2216360.1 spore coat protein [Virgibacillus dakarensis]MTW86550.1 spore coat protein [Virgibacillus dakarensis]GGB46826.1 spore coat protein [Lentibacillus populi]
MEQSRKHRPEHLAWHETLEIHELVAFQSIGLMKLKSSVGEVKDNMLRNLYVQCIKDIENNIKELVQFYSLAPREDDEEREFRNLGTGFYAGDLLILAKTSVKNYATAITETATPMLRETLIKHLQKAIEAHANVFSYMYDKGLYPAYNLEKLLKNDLKNANMALQMHYK